MTKNRRSLYALLTACALLSVLVPLGGSPRSAYAEDSHLFPETGKTVKGRFLEYWTLNGGLAQQGYPITEEVQEQSDTDGQVYTMQYFQRSVFEMHPEKARPYDVLLSLLGVFYYNINYGGNAPSQHVNTDNPRLFTETGKTVGGAFREYWESHGALAQQGYPISEEFTEVSPTNGQSYTVQYFQRAVFEFHPENPAPNNVLLSLLGVFYYGDRHGVVGPPPTATPFGNPTAEPTATPTSVPQDNSGQVIFYNDQTAKSVIGRVDASGNYADLKTYTTFATGWTHIVPLGQGYIFFYAQTSGLTTLGRVANDGTYTDIQSSYALGAGWTHIVPAENNIILYYKAGTGTGGTARVNLDGSVTLLKVYTTFATNWTHIVEADNGVLVFYARGTPVAATVSVDSDGNLTQLKVFNNWTTIWDRLVPGINNTVLQYYTIDGRAVVSKFDTSGNETVLMRYPDASGNPPLPNPFPIVVGLSNGTLLFYNDSTTAGITARIGGDGSIPIYNQYPAGNFGVWTHISAIR